MQCRCRRRRGRHRGARPHAHHSRQRVRHVKGKRYFDYPMKYYATDAGIRNALLNFRQIEETHLMENVIYNELVLRPSFSSDSELHPQSGKVWSRSSLPQPRRYSLRSGICRLAEPLPFGATRAGRALHLRHSLKSSPEFSPPPQSQSAPGPGANPSPSTRAIIALSVCLRDSACFAWDLPLRNLPPCGAAPLWGHSRRGPGANPSPSTRAIL